MTVAGHDTYWEVKSKTEHCRLKSGLEVQYHILGQYRIGDKDIERRTSSVNSQCVVYPVKPSLTITQLVSTPP